MADPIKVIEDIIEAQDKLADFIANGPGEGLPGFVRNQYRDRCDEFANVPQWAKNLNPIGQLSFGRFCRPYWDDQGTSPPERQPPFTGGQCNAEAYLVVTSWLNVVTGQRQVFNSTAFGPITGVRISNPSGTNNILELGCRGRRASSTCGSIPNELLPPGFYQVAQSAGDRTQPRIDSVSPCGADNCGNPPEDLVPGPNPPPNPGPGPVGDPVDNPDGGPIPDIPIPPFTDPVGGPTEIDPGPEPGGGGGGEPMNPPNATGGDGLPGDEDAVGGDAGSATGGEDGEDIDFGPPPAGKVWVGALIECTVDPRLGNIPGTGPQNTVYPTAIANASLRYSTGYGTSRVIRSKWTELARPVTALVVEGCFVQAQPGVTASAKPISATICPENPCESE